MKAKHYILIATAAMMLSACVKDSLYNTPHPDKGAVAVALTGMAAGDSYVVEIDGQTAVITGSPFTCPWLFSPGTYSMVVYNRAEGFSFDGLTARVNASGDQNTGIVPLPGYLKSARMEITILADDTLRVNTVPTQRVRDLILELEVTQGRPELIHSVTGTITGIAGAFDLELGQTAGEPTATTLSFTREENMLKANARLLGTAGTAQTMVLDVTFTDNSRTQKTVVDLTNAMADFNADMTTAYKVTGELETPVGMEEGSGTITGWSPVDGGEVDAEM